MKRGQVWWADLGEPRGSSPAFRRPVLIAQDDPLNGSALPTVMVVPLTSNLKRAHAAGNVRLSESETGLDRPSVALVCQVITIEKDVLDDLVGSLSKRALSRIDTGLRLTLGLGFG